jgi:hypothetical protein
MAQTNRPKASSLGVILSDATYPLAEFQKLSGLGEAALRQARRQGLVVTAIGRRRFVRGADFYEFIGRRGVKSSHKTHPGKQQRR